MPYIGNALITPGANIKSYKYRQGTDTSTGATSFPAVNKGADELRVYLNGSLLKFNADYTFTTSAVTISPAPADDDEIQVDVYTSMNIADTVSASDGGTFIEPVVFQNGIKTGAVKAQDGTSAISVADSTGVVAVASTLDVSAGTLTTSTTQKEAIVDGGKGNLARGDVGLGNVDNTTDLNKPVSTATTTALNLKAPIASPTFTGTVAIPNVANLETAVVANTAKVTNATHTGDVTGGTALTIANDAVDSQHYAADSIDAEHYAPGSVDTTAMAASVIGVKPHIIPGVLYPAVAGKLLDGTTSHGATYGVAQADGYSYYYTDIKGSKPIKDPRIGAHFGSQRYTFRSKQLLEQETATHGNNVYSVDGRKWCRIVGSTWTEQNGNDGVRYYTDTVGNFVEITGYFSGANYLTFSSTTNDIALAIDGTTDTATYTGGTATVDSPLADRYVNMSVCVNLAFSSAPTLGIHTLKIFVVSGDYIRIEGIELIAQDTTDADTKLQIQIPSQNVVSYGKKFTVSGTPHYDPFNGFTSGTAISGYIDEATSLGMSNWKVSSTWYRPFNGGRVVKWVDSSGTIKTSVNMMPPNAQNISTTASNAIDLSSSQTNDDTINFNTSAIDHSQAEVAKTFHWREFGNGAANEGTGGANYADASMLSGTSDDIAYVMDDGLTSLSGDDMQFYTPPDGLGDLMHVSDADVFYITFIGTGITVSIHAGATGADEYDKFIDGIQVVDGATSRTVSVISPECMAQNLPYGTHILKVQRQAADAYNEFYREFTFHQPKMPPIPEDAVVLADYMLMADFVAQGAVGIEKISKGVRLISCSRDVFFEAGTASPALYINMGSSVGGFQCDSNVNTAVKFKLPFFGNGIQYYWSNSATYSMVNVDMTIDGSAASTGNFSGLTASTPSGSYNSSTGVLTPTGGTRKGEVLSLTGLGLGQRTLQSASASDPSGNNRFRIDAFSVETPIHTSSHYQTFETPFLHELVGGDRNMEQTNLVVTPDGKTWDEVTRDTSYIGNGSLTARSSSGGTTGDFQTNQHYKLDEWRGVYQGLPVYNKDWAIAYDRNICLRDGAYLVNFNTLRSAAATGQEVSGISINGVSMSQLYSEDADHRTVGQHSFIYNFKRGDYIQIMGIIWSGKHTHYNITRV